MEGIVAITYRCNAHCQMCNTWQFPTKPAEEISPADVAKLPTGLDFVNITGGEPFIRDDIEDFVKILQGKAERIVISTNGYFTDKIIELAKKHPDVGIRVSLEGFANTNDKMRGIEGGFERGLKTLVELNAMGHKDIGFGITLSDGNYHDLVPLFYLSEAMRLEFATAAVHNSFYFHKQDNVINRKDEMIAALERLINELLKSKRAKNWFRAYFNHGLINYVRGNPRLVECLCGSVLFFVDPFGEVRPCNGMDESFGNIKDSDWRKIWDGEKAQEIRKKVANCPSNCWMIGSVSPLMKKKILATGLWVAKHKLRAMLGKTYCASK
jgi:MoaA/NifB/PqqE/SkfB family radical SAM enzyme